MKKKEHTQNEKINKKIIDEIRKRVIEESENLKAEKEHLEKEMVTLEALQEITDIPLERIKRIADDSQVRAAGKPEHRTLPYFLWGLIFWFSVD
jgi:hypothetical protein